MLTKRLLAGASAVALAGTALILTTRAADAATNYGVAPYVDLSAGSADFLDTAITQGHLTAFTAAFVISSGCTPIWGDTLGIDNSTVNPRLARAKSEGAQPIISFGGAGGVELGQGCTSLTGLQAAYQSVITHYGVNHIDFDIEGAAIADTASVDRRFKAIKGLENANPGLNVSVTIPVLESGPDYWGSAFLASAASNGVRLDIINAMTMDYGHANSNMATAAETAAAGTLSAARAAGLNVGYANIGITPMIGANDSAGEVVSQANAQTIVNWAHANGIGRLAFWSIGRDQPCAGGGVSPNCSGIGGTALDFTRIFLAGGGGTGPTTPPTTAPTTRPTTPPATTPPTTPPASATTWVANHAYKVGDVVTYAGVSYRCLQSHTSLTGWEPPNVPALWQRL